MFDFKSTETIESAVIPSVRFTIRKPTQGRRTELHLSIAEVAARYDAKIRELDKLRVETKSDDGSTVVSWSDTSEANRIAAEADIIDICELTPRYIRWGLLSVEGLAIDGEPATVETLLSSGPEDIIPEIRDAVKRQLGLTLVQQKNSQAPTTSSEAVGVEPKPTIASTANTPGCGVVAPATEGAPVSAI